MILRMRRDITTSLARRMRALTLTALLGLLAALPACPAGPSSRPAPRARASTLPPVHPGSVKVYKGADGIRVAMVRLQDGTYLVRVTGSTHPLDGKVIRCRFANMGGSEQVWITPYDGFDLWLLRRRVFGAQGPVYLLNLPGQGFLQNLPVTFEEPASAALPASELVTAHEAQLADGSLKRLLAFDVARRIRQEEARIARDVAYLNKRCRTSVRMTVDWDAIPKKTQRTLAVRDGCSEALSALGFLCDDRVARETLRAHLDEVRCRVEPGDRVVVRLEGRTLHYTLGRKVRNRHLHVIKHIAEDLRWPGGENLARKIHRARHLFFTDGKGHFVGWRPMRAPDRWEGSYRRMHFGTATKLTEVPFNRYLGESWFFDPRQKSRWSRMRYLSFDMETYSRLDWNERTGQSVLICGTRRVPLKRASPAEVAGLVAKATWAPPLPRREPHGLARDRKGIYYYVDKAEGKGAQDYRLYRGPLGRMTSLKMINIVSDTEGEVYSTKNGSLRLVLEKEHSFWVSGRQRSTLINVPIPKNQALIYNELGVYLGQPFGTPCDIF